MAGESHKLHFVRSLVQRTRLLTREVTVGNLAMGAAFPVRIQSMTNTPTMDILATVAQARQLFESGCDYVRITARNLAEAKNLAEIKKQLHHDGFHQPLIADVHFNPDVALLAARLVEKVRINPGNYADRNDSFTGDAAGSERETAAAIGNITIRLKPLVDVCREYGTAIRVGVNHGSLSRRILARFGNTPDGMVESAMEFIRIISGLGFHNLVLSMKSSDIHVMIHAYRLLVKHMEEQGFDYPLHLGVTEAGGGEDGLIKSAAGIGTLLADGIGDTLRVSLTGDPLAEVPVAVRLAHLFMSPVEPKELPEIQPWFDPFCYMRRRSEPVNIIGGTHPVAVMVNGFSEESGSDFFFEGKAPDNTLRIHDAKCFLSAAAWQGAKNAFPLFLSPSSFGTCTKVSPVMNLIMLHDAGQVEEFMKLHRRDKTVVALFECDARHQPGEVRLLFKRFTDGNCDAPVMIKAPFSTGVAQADTAAYLAALLADGFGDAVWVDNSSPDDAAKAAQFAFSLLQAHGLRRTRAEFISCPTCGRTTYDVETVLAGIQRLAGHMSQLKIGVMGCIVNGPGEMAGADYGCVGSAPGKVNIFRGEKIIYKNISEHDAAARLWELIVSCEYLSGAANT